MSSKLKVTVIALLALAALEFGMLGASAAGLVGGSGRALPPVPQRGSLQAPATPTAAPPTGPGVPYRVELLRPIPDAIDCDGVASSLIRVVVRDSSGNPVPDGTYVYFSVFNGAASPYTALATSGAVVSQIVIYSDSYSGQPNVIVDVGDLEVAVRVRCKPNSNSGCPLSPPAPLFSPPCAPTPYPCNPSPSGDSVSPPCATPTPTPYPCNPSPGSGPISPPCETVPPCNPSPPGDAVSPPCATPTPYPCTSSPPGASVSPPCATPSPTPRPCVPSRDRAASPPCATATPIPHCAPWAPASPPCAPPTPPSPNVRCADVTGDGRVAGNDVWFVARNVLSRHPDPRADVNGDGHVDGRDVTFVVKQLGRRC